MAISIRPKNDHAPQMGCATFEAYVNPQEEDNAFWDIPLIRVVITPTTESPRSPSGEWCMNPAELRRWVKLASRALEDVDAQWAANDKRWREEREAREAI